jgi:hypothetical protein
MDHILMLVDPQQTKDRNQQQNQIMIVSIRQQKYGCGREQSDMPFTNAGAPVPEHAESNNSK